MVDEIKNPNEEFEKMIAKYSLPSIKELEKEFGKFTVDDEGFLVTIIKKMHEKVGIYTKFIEEMLQPESTITNMQEASIFSQEDQTKMFAIFRKMTYHERLILRVEMNYDDEILANYFKTFFTDWQNSKESVLFFVNKAITVWEGNGTNTKQNEGYFG